MAEIKKIEDLFDGDGKLSRKELQDLEELSRSKFITEFCMEMGDDSFRQALDSEVMNYLKRNINPKNKEYVYSLYNKIRDKAGLSTMSMEEFLMETEKEEGPKVAASQDGITTTKDGRQHMVLPVGQKKEIKALKKKKKISSQKADVPVLKDTKKTAPTEDKRMFEVDGEKVEVTINTLESGLVNISIDDDMGNTDIVGVPKDEIDNVMEYYTTVFASQESVFGDTLEYGKDEGLTVFLKQKERGDMLQGQLNIKTHDADEFQEQVSQANLVIAEKIEDLEGKEEEIISLMEQVGHYKNEMIARGVLLKEANEKIEDLQAKVEGKEGVLKYMDATLEEEKAKVVSLTSEVEAMRAKIESNLAKVESLTKELQATREELAASDLESEDLTSKLADLQKSFDFLTNSLADASEKLKNQEQTIASLKANMDAMGKNLDEEREARLEAEAKLESTTDTLASERAEDVVPVKYDAEKNVYTYQGESISRENIPSEDKLMAWKRAIDVAMEESAQQYAKQWAEEVGIPYDEEKMIYEHKSGEAIPRDKIESKEQLVSWIDEMDDLYRKMQLRDITIVPIENRPIVNAIKSVDLKGITKPSEVDGAKWQTWLSKFSHTGGDGEIKISKVELDVNKEMDAVLKFDFDDAWTNESYNKGHTISLDELLTEDFKLNENVLKQEIKKRIVVAINKM